MALFWLALGAAVVAIAGSALFLTRRALDSFRAFKSLTRSLGEGLQRIETTSAQIEERLARGASAGERLEAELEQLRRSRARLNVLTSALADVRASLGRVTAVYPRK